MTTYFSDIIFFSETSLRTYVLASYRPAISELQLVIWVIFQLSSFWGVQILNDYPMIHDERYLQPKTWTLYCVLKFELDKYVSNMWKAIFLELSFIIYR